ncbi:DNA cytosine methyltransferase [Falsiroseomonas oryzae]|uniref:DNA cytosine methyltransferase n=1 Tax=Falsiroseomonas oryzae TaxID=2766473 RepID=UPI0022EAEF4D|nr:DNA cytosine methyltransferase [Roseomonas sp. MO-31]
MDAAIAAKIERLRNGGAPRVLDLFSGCGGMSVGFQRAAFQIVAGIDRDPEAIASHALNFHAGTGEDTVARLRKPRNIETTEPEGLLADLGCAGRPEQAIDIVVGGPPCQAYARVGRAKLAAVSGAKDAFLTDGRGQLHRRYLHYVERLRPLALLMENVPDALNYGGENVIQRVADRLHALGYVARYGILNAADYGVPQIRLRVFLMAYREELGIIPAFPERTHQSELPIGYRGTLATALQQVDLFSTQDYTVPPAARRDAPAAISAKEALQDLPLLSAHLSEQAKRGPRRFTTAMPYAAQAASRTYAADMREWPGFEAPDGISDHVIRHLPRDFPIFREMNPGDEYPEALEAAERLVQRELKARRQAGRQAGVMTAEKLRKKMVPPYPVGSYPNRWWKLIPDRPSRTLLAHLGKDSYTHIHYAKDQARTISVREAARLQSFPDGFRFYGAMNAAFRQIGNAVPPLLAFKLACTMADTLKGVAGATPERETDRQIAEA